MTSKPPTGTRERVIAGAWLDDLAVIAAHWLDKHPVRRRLLLAMVLLFTGPALVTTSSFAMVGLLLLLLPRLPRLHGRIALGVGLAATLAGAGRLLSAEWDWTSFPREDGPGLTLFAVGILLGARRGPWLPWLTFGVLAGVMLDSPWSSAVTLNVWPIGGTLLLILVARISAAPRTESGTAAARAHFAVALQRRPWLTSFLVCMIAITMPTAVLGIAPTLGVLLVALLFHATWRTPALFDKASAWTAAMVVPAANVLFLWWIPAQASWGNTTFAGGQSVWDAVLSPVMALPLLVGLLFGRRPPNQPFTPLDGLLTAAAVLAAPATIVIVEAVSDGPAHFAHLPRMYRVAMAHPLLWATATGLWLPLFQRLVSTSVSARRIVIGAAAAGAVQLGAFIAVTLEDETTVTLTRGALYPVVQWVVGALILLLARDVARVTRIPDEHHLIADRTPVTRR